MSSGSMEFDDSSEDEYMEDAKGGKRFNRSIDVIEEDSEQLGQERSKRGGMGWFTKKGN